ncbi:hypothetical protein Tco_0722543 [Tanacetum coccineum]
MQHHLTIRQSALPDTKAKRSPNQLHLNLSLSSEEESDPEQAQRDKEMQKICTPFKYFRMLHKPTNNNLRTLKLQEQDRRYHTKIITQINSSRHPGNQRTMTDAGARK